MFAAARRRKPAEYREARRLRRDQGMPMKRIAARVGVSIGTVHAWTRDIELRADQKWRNLHGPRGPANPAHVAARAATWRKRNRAKRLAYQREGRARARDGDPLHMAGCMLYWAEGKKNRNRVQLVNSDMDMVRFFCRFLRTCFDLGPEEFRVALNFYTGNGISIQEIERRWLAALDLPHSSLNKHTINAFPTSSSGRKKNRLPYGVCTLTVTRSTRIVQHICGAIQEYVGSDEPRWLD